MCRFLARYSVCFQSGRTILVAIGCESLCVCVCALHMACSCAFVSLLGWNSGNERVVSVQTVLVRESAKKACYMAYLTNMYWLGVGGYVG